MLGYFLSACRLALGNVCQSSVIVSEDRLHRVNVVSECFHSLVCVRSRLIEVGHKLRGVQASDLLLVVRLADESSIEIIHMCFHPLGSRRSLWSLDCILATTLRGSSIAFLRALHGADEISHRAAE